MPARITGDPGRLAQIVTNLVANGIKFSEAAPVHVRVLAGGAFVKVTVTDHGIGLSPEEQSRVFAKFEQASAATSRIYGGTGLGLPICKELAELSGGSIGVTSTPGRGSTFWFTFPLHAAATQGLAAEPRPAAEPCFAGLTALIADDNRTNRLIARGLLRSLGVAATCAADGREAVNACARNRFDIVFMDIRMPDMDGIQATRAVRAGSGPNRSTPIVALTANTQDDQVQEYLRAGMSHWLGKPVRKADLAATLRRFCPSPSMAGKHRAQAPL